MVFETTYLGNGLVMLLSLFFLAVLLLFFAFKLDDEHTILKLICIFFAFFVVLLIPKTALDYSGDCILTVSNSTTVGDTTTYQYESNCYANTHATQTTAYTTMLWFLRIIIIYFGIWVFWKFMQQSEIFTKRFK